MLSRAFEDRRERAVRVALVDDSLFLRRALARRLDEEPGIELVGVAGRGEELLENLVHWRPDLIVLDLAMPGIGGLATLEEILVRRPTPVIVLSDGARRGALTAVEALQRGAVDCVEKRDLSPADFQILCETLAGRIRELGSPRCSEPCGAEPRREPRGAPALPSPAPLPCSPALLLLGASAGGPAAIERVLRDLGPRPAVPVVVAQHMPPGFTWALASRLTADLALDVRETAAGEPLLPGRVYLAPSGFHTTVQVRPCGLYAVLTEAVDRVQRSIDALFASAAGAAGPRTVAALLTGFGEDGVRGMTALAKAGAYTIAQDESTSTAFGMPRAAIAAGAAREVLPLTSIGGRLRRLVARPRGRALLIRGAREPGDFLTAG
jgi:two-component system, chemotaxis family, protein-glutamate methylesterase/glutaminase